MKYQYNTRTFNIPDEELKTNMKILGITQDEAVQMWLEDNGYKSNNIVEELTAKAKEVKIRHEARSLKAETSQRKPRERKPDLEKENIIETLHSALISQGIEAKITNKSKIIEFSIGENHYKLDLIKQRQPKE